MYPLAIIDTASITSLVRMTQYHHVHHTAIETSEGVAVLVGDIRRGRSAKNQMATESERKTLP